MLAFGDAVDSAINVHQEFHIIMLFLILSLVFDRSGISKIAKNFVNAIPAARFF